MTGTAADEYILGRTNREYERLDRQSKIWEPITLRILLQAGLQKGMKCLDVGCGTGAVMRLIGNVVGKAGSVTGFDLDEPLGKFSVNLLNDEGRSHYFFQHGNIEEVEKLPGGPYDFVFTRLMLIHLNSPENAIKKMFDVLKPGGVLLLQDYDMSIVHLSKSSNEVDVYFIKLLIKTFTAMGKDPMIGIRLPYLIKKVIGKDADGIDASSMITSAEPALSMFKSVFQSILPAAKKLGFANESNFEKFSEACEKYLDGSQEVTGLWPLLGSAWIRK